MKNRLFLLLSLILALCLSNCQANRDPVVASFNQGKLTWTEIEEHVKIFKQNTPDPQNHYSELKNSIIDFFILPQLMAVEARKKHQKNRIVQQKALLLENQLLINYYKKKIGREKYKQHLIALQKKSQIHKNYQALKGEDKNLTLLEIEPYFKFNQNDLEFRLSLSAGPDHLNYNYQLPLVVPAHFGLKEKISYLNNLILPQALLYNEAKKQKLSRDPDYQKQLKKELDFFYYQIFLFDLSTRQFSITEAEIKSYQARQPSGLELHLIKKKLQNIKYYAYLEQWQKEQLALCQLKFNDHKFLALIKKKS